MYTKNFSSYENVNSQQCLRFLMTPQILQFTFAFQRHRPDILMKIRTINQKESKFEGRGGFVKCDCKSKCQTQKWKCKQSTIKCDSKCHNSLPRCNKQ